MKKTMTVEERIRRCLLIEKMGKDKDYCEKVGIKNESTLYGITEPEYEKDVDLQSRDIL